MNFREPWNGSKQLSAATTNYKRLLPGLLGSGNLFTVVVGPKRQSSRPGKPGERGSVFAGVGDEDARLLRRWHGAIGHYQPRSWRRQLTVYDVGLKIRCECSAQPLGSHSKDFTFLSCVARLRITPEDSSGSDPVPNRSQAQEQTAILLAASARQLPTSRLLDKLTGVSDILDRSRRDGK